MDLLQKRIVRVCCSNMTIDSPVEVFFTYMTRLVLAAHCGCLEPTKFLNIMSGTRGFRGSKYYWQPRILRPRAFLY